MFFFFFADLVVIESLSVLRTSNIMNCYLQGTDIGCSSNYFKATIHHRPFKTFLHPIQVSLQQCYDYHLFPPILFLIFISLSFPLTLSLLYTIKIDQYTLECKKLNTCTITKLKVEVAEVGDINLIL